MTRRIALAILLCACVMLVAAGVAGYVAMHQALQLDLDERLIDRATAVLRHMRAGEQDLEASVPQGDHFVIRDASGKSITRLPSNFQLPEQPTVLTNGFATDSSGRRVRAMSLRWEDPQNPESVSIIYTTPVERFERTMNRLAVTLMAVLGAGVIATAAVAGSVSGIALRPLHETAKTIGDIDERRLSRRIEIAELPRELVPIATRLNEMLERLERAFAQRRQFMIGAAHELRSPVAALRTTLEVALQRPKDAAALTLVLQKCLISTQMLNRLANLLTEQLRDELPARADELELCDVGALLQECADVAEPLARTKEITLVRTFPPALPLITNPDRLNSMVMNLLSNAIEYTPAHGQVELEGSFDGLKLALAVQDTGVGIAPEHLPHITQPFYRADRARRDRAHLGLGLYLVKSNAEALGGTCHVSSQPGQGTTVILVIPARPPMVDTFDDTEQSLDLPAHTVG